jgi:hypothetical protein
VADDGFRFAFADAPRLVEPSLFRLRSGDNLTRQSNWRLPGEWRAFGLVGGSGCLRTAAFNVFRRQIGNFTRTKEL